MTETTNRRGRAPRYPDDAVFELIGVNPWPTTNKSGAILARVLDEVPEPRTIGALRAAGMPRSYVNNLVDHGRARVISA